MNVAELQKSIEVFTSHSAQCGGTCTLEGESMHSGLAVVFRAVCRKCSKVFSICSSPRVVTQKGKKWCQSRCCAWSNDNRWGSDSMPP